MHFGVFGEFWIKLDVYFEKVARFDEMSGIYKGNPILLFNTPLQLKFVLCQNHSNPLYLNLKNLRNPFSHQVKTSIFRNFNQLCDLVVFYLEFCCFCGFFKCFCEFATFAAGILEDFWEFVTFQGRIGPV